MTDLPAVDAAAVAWIDTDQMREIDRIMIEDLHIELLQMMENAGVDVTVVLIHDAADISVPPEVTERIGGRPAPPFRLGPVLQLRAG